MKKLILISLVLGSYAMAGDGVGDVGSGVNPRGIICSQNTAPMGGGLSVLKLVKNSDNTYNMLYTTANGDGSNPKQVLLGKNMNCSFSSIDAVVGECRGANEIIPERHLSDYVQISRNTTLTKNAWSDGEITYYSVKLAAPSVDDATLKSIDRLNYNQKNKSLGMSFPSDNNGLSNCKSF